MSFSSIINDAESHSRSNMIMPLALALAFLWATTTGASASEQAESPTPERLSFQREIAPILVKHCLACHDDQKSENGLNLSTLAKLKQGGSGTGSEILVPGKPEESALIEVIRADAEPRMPYKQPPLSTESIRRLERWVAEGAKNDGSGGDSIPLTSLVDPSLLLPTVKPKVKIAAAVSAVGFSPDGRLFAAAQDGDVLIEPIDGKGESRHCSGFPGRITSLRFSPSGDLLIATGGRPGISGVVWGWDVQRKARRFELRGHTDLILAADLSPDGRLLATASYDRTILVWDLARGQIERTLKEHTDAVYDVVFDKLGRRLLSASGDRTAKLWDLATGKRLVTCSDSTAELYAVAFSPDGASLIAAGVDRTLRVWDASATLKATVLAHQAPITQIMRSSKGDALLTAGEDRLVKLWSWPELRPVATWKPRSDWPLALAVHPDGQRIAVGVQDGSLQIARFKDGEILRELLRSVVSTSSVVDRAKQPKPDAPSPPVLFQPVSLNPPSPRGARLGGAQRVTLTGQGVGRAQEVFFLEPGLSAKVVPQEKPDPNRLLIDLAVPETARVGFHKLGVRTPEGVTPLQEFAVFQEPELAETEPNEQANSLPTRKPGALLVGAIQTPGDFDLIRFEVQREKALIVELVNGPLGSALKPRLELLDASGSSLATATTRDGGREPVLILRSPSDQVVTLKISDQEFGGSANHFYRIRVHQGPYRSGVFPLSVAPGQGRTLRQTGANGPEHTPLEVTAPAQARPGSLITIKAVPGSDKTSRVVVLEGEQAEEREPNDSGDQAHRLPVPGGVTGRLASPGEVDVYSFEAKKGQRLILESFARRLGGSLDTLIELTDREGRPITRALLRPIAQTKVAFRDHGSLIKGIRLTQWNDFAISDYVLIGRELMRIQALPKNPDDDCVFWNINGERAGFLETTPEQHPMGQTLTKVEILPPDAGSAEGETLIPLMYRNDDGGSVLGKDSRLTFDPPADGTYFAQISDVRGQAGEPSAYVLAVHPPRPGFTLEVANENPNVPRAGHAVVAVSIHRHDGFAQPVDVRFEGLPKGVRATEGRIESEMNSTELLLSASGDAPGPDPTDPPNWTIIARAVGEDGQEIVRTLDPGGKRSGWVSIIPRADLKVLATPEKITIRPGEQVPMKFAVERGAAFKGRVPIDVRNLPHGVRVLNIGLNGVLVTEKQSERSIILFAEPWVQPTQRPFFAVGRIEASRMEASSPALLLNVEPAARSVAKGKVTADGDQP